MANLGVHGDVLPRNEERDNNAGNREQRIFHVEERSLISIRRKAIGRRKRVNVAIQVGTPDEYEDR